MLRLLVVFLVFFGFAFHSLSFSGSLERVFGSGDGLNDMFHWGALQLIFVVLVGFLCSLVKGPMGIKTAYSILPIPFSIIATISFLIYALKRSSLTAENPLQFIFDSLMGGGFSFLMAAVLTSLGGVYVIKEDLKSLSATLPVRPRYVIFFSYVILWGCILQLVFYSRVPFYLGFFHAKDFFAVFFVTAAFYFSMVGLHKLVNFKELEIDWGKVADSALYTTFLFCALSFFEWMTVIYYQSRSSGSELAVSGTMGDLLSLGWLYFFWSAALLITAHIHICFQGDHAQLERALKRNWHLLELFGFFVFLTVAPPNLIDMNWQ